MGNASDHVGNEHLEMYYGMSDDRYVQAEIWNEMVEIIPEVLLPRFPNYTFSTHVITGVRSQLNPKMWLSELRFEHEEYLKSYLKQGVIHGFKIIDDDIQIMPYECENYQSVLKGDSWKCID